MARNKTVPSASDSADHRATVRVREAGPRDAEAIERMSREFIAQSAYSDELDPVLLHGLAVLWCSGESEWHKAFVLETDDGGRLVGMLVALVYPHILTGRREASEIVWWVEKPHRTGGHGLRLLETAVAWARTMGATRFQVVAKEQPALERWYRRLGFTVHEVSYAQEL